MIHKYADCLAQMLDFCDKHGFSHRNFYYLRDIIKSVGPERILSIDEIKKIVSDYFHLRPGEIEERRRFGRLRLPRQFAQYYSCLLTDRSLNDIGAKTGGYGHANVINSRKVIENLKVTKHPRGEFVNYLDLEILFGPFIRTKESEKDENVQ